jgi:hypothetical protein
VAIFGVVLFLYGSNYYSASVGWVGVFLIIIGIAMEISLEIYGAIRKKEVG